MRHAADPPRACTGHARESDPRAACHPPRSWARSIARPIGGGARTRRARAGGSCCAQYPCGSAHGLRAQLGARSRSRSRSRWAGGPRPQIRTVCVPGDATTYVRTEIDAVSPWRIRGAGCIAQASSRGRSRGPTAFIGLPQSETAPVGRADVRERYESATTRPPRHGGMSWVMGSPGCEGVITERSRASTYVLYDCWHGLEGGGPSSASGDRNLPVKCAGQRSRIATRVAVH